MRRLNFFQFFTSFTIKILMLGCIFTYLQYFLGEQTCLGKPIFNNMSRRSHSSLINNIVTNKIKYFPQLLALGPQIVLKRKRHCFLFLSNITTKLDMFNILDIFISINMITFARVYCKLTSWSQ